MIYRPKLWIFNPDSEMAIADGNYYYTPPANIVRMSEELAFLPAYFSDRGDAVLVSHKFSCNFLESRKEILGLDVECLGWEEREKFRDYKIEPWGWSPRMQYLMGMQSGNWNREQKELYSRRTALNVLKGLGAAEKVFPQVCFSLKEVGNYTKTEDCVVKAPWSSSGKGVLVIPRGGFGKRHIAWVEGILRKQGYVMVERKLDKVVDFAMEFYVDNFQRVRFIGLSLFQTGLRGEYKGNFVGDQHFIQKQLSRWIPQEQFERIRVALEKQLAATFAASGYTGPLGVDMMIYREGGKIDIQPCLEINLRYNMGILALTLAKRWVDVQSKGFFSVLYFPRTEEALQRDRVNRFKYPLRMKNGQIVSGYLSLTPIEPDTRFVAELLVDGV